MGLNATFNCSATAEPPHSVLWFFNGTQQLSPGDHYIIVDESAMLSVLTVVNVVPTDDGEYTCDVRNDYGDDTSTASLTVICKSCDIT